MQYVLIPIIMLGTMALIFGAGLAYAGQKLAVEVDERIPKVRACLPGANCGACGFPGCDGLASAIVEGRAEINACPVGGASAAAKIAKIMGVESQDTGVRMVATIICQGSSDHCKPRFDYDGPMDCQAAVLASGGDKSCRYACLGLGSCQAVCPFGAITIENGLAHIDKEKCQGCKKCIAVCPKNVIRMEPEDLPVLLKCRSAEKGKAVRDNCLAGCLACGKCYRNCKYGAITMENNLPVIDRSKCVGCMECAVNCPTAAIWGNFENRLIADIDQDKCIGCTLCERQCKYGAIIGSLKEKHSVDATKCTGCGQCVTRCRPQAIHLRKRVESEKNKHKF